MIFWKYFYLRKKKKKEKKNIFWNILNPKHILRTLNEIAYSNLNETLCISIKKKKSHMTHASLSFESLSLCTYLSMTLYFRKFCLTLTFIHIKRRKLNSYVQIDLINAIPIKHLFDLNSVSIINPISLKRLLAIKCF